MDSTSEEDFNNPAGTYCLHEDMHQCIWIDCMDRKLLLQHEIFLDVKKHVEDCDKLVMAHVPFVSNKGDSS